jgi:hypothetical protein
LLLFSGPLAFSTAVGTGFRPIGRRGTVSRADYGVINEIDGRPAGEFVQEYVSSVGPATFGNPLAVYQPGSDDWYLRVMIAEDDEGAVAVPGVVAEGATVQLTTASTDEIVRATTDVVDRAAAAFPKDATPSAALLFSCAVRRFMLGTRTQQEVVEARSLLPAGIAVAGMYCGGEIAPVTPGEESRFHNETFVAVLLGG